MRIFVFLSFLLKVKQVGLCIKMKYLNEVSKFANNELNKNFFGLNQNFANK